MILYNNQASHEVEITSLLQRVKPELALNQMEMTPPTTMAFDWCVKHPEPTIAQDCTTKRIARVRDPGPNMTRTQAGRTKCLKGTVESALTQ